MFYGRRKGKPLHAGRRDAYESILPGITIRLPQNDAKVDPASFFDVSFDDIWMEIGFGDGEQLAHLAANNPRIGFIGCEPFVNGIAKLCLDIREMELKNIRIWPDDARKLLPRLPDACLGRCYLLNSDPWPKTRHHKRRFVQSETLDTLHRLLKPGAEFRMSSDHPDLAVWQLEKTFFHGGFDWLAQDAANWRDRPADMRDTRYQRKGATQGRPTYFLNFRKRDI